MQKLESQLGHQDGEAQRLSALVVRVKGEAANAVATAKEEFEGDMVSLNEENTSQQSAIVSLQTEVSGLREEKARWVDGLRSARKVAADLEAKHEAVRRQLKVAASPHVSESFPVTRLGFAPLVQEELDQTVIQMEAEHKNERRALQIRLEQTHANELRRLEQTHTASLNRECWAECFLATCAHCRKRRAVQHDPRPIATR